MKPRLPILLAATVLVQVLGWGLYAAVGLLFHEIEKEGKEELRTFHFANAAEMQALEWMHAKEFRFEGEMYDLASKKLNADGSIELLAWKDAKEDRLRHALKLSEKASEEGSGLEFGLPLAPPEPRFALLKLGLCRLSVPENPAQANSGFPDNLAPPPEMV